VTSDDLGDDGAPRAPLFEVRLHALSPFGPLVTAALFAAALYGLYLLIAYLTGEPVIETGADGRAYIDEVAWTAFILSLVFAAALTMPVLGERQWRASLDAIVMTLDAPGASLARAMARGRLRSRARGAILASLVGALGGLIFNVWLMQNSGLGAEQYLRSTGAWFVLVAPLLFGLGARASQLLRSDDHEMVALVTDHISVSPAHFDRLEVYGRLALRSALTWLVMAAIIGLFFVYSAPVSVSIGALSLALLASAYAFTSTIMPVVRVTSQRRREALDGVRAHIEAEAHAALASSGAPGRLSDLTAYEAWLEKRPIWPVSAPVTRRLAVYGLIPVLAWFGAAAAQLLVGVVA
jgi:hypothetical protein